MVYNCKAVIIIWPLYESRHTLGNGIKSIMTPFKTFNSNLETEMWNKNTNKNTTQSAVFGYIYIYLY